jgi:carboxyl-terminal processing protease
MIRRCFALLVALVVILSVAGTGAPADVGLVNEVLEVLRTRHWNPNLDLPALVRAGVGGLRGELQRSGIEASDLQEIPAGADRAQAVAAFGDRLDRAVQRAAGHVSEHDLLYAGLRAMVNAVGGSHTLFLSPGAYAARIGNYTGIGIGFGKSDAQWTVLSVAPGGPADSAGVRPGDVLARIGNVVAATLGSYDDVASLLVGDEGTTVQVTLRRQSAERTLSIVRRRVVWPMVVSWMLGGRIGYLKLYGFFSSDGAANEIRAAVVRLLGANSRALIVDLRENLGGDDRVALDTISLFLPSGTKVAERLSRNGITPWSTTGDPIVPAIPVVALIGPGTVSNGEVMAAALKEHRGATLVGTRTAGRLEFGVYVRLSDGSALEVAVAQIRTSAGVEIEGRGYPPDVEVSPAAGGDQDPQLQRAIQIIMQR